MTDNISDISTVQERWARFRFSIIGPLLSSPPAEGELRSALEALAKKPWRHPITGEAVYFGISTIERWLYQARPAQNPINKLKSKKRSDTGKSKKINCFLKQAQLPIIARVLDIAKFHIGIQFLIFGHQL